MISMAKSENGDTAFEQGRRAGNDRGGPRVANPFLDGSAEHNNFEVGRRFGAENTAAHERGRDKPYVISSGEAS
jgi:hypothetical protein